MFKVFGIRAGAKVCLQINGMEPLTPGASQEKQGVRPHR